jgi:hypothetical protein
MDAKTQNQTMLAAFTRSGLLMEQSLADGAIHVTLSLAAGVQLDTVRGTPHLCGSGSAKSNALPDKSGVPSATRQLRLSLCQGGTTGGGHPK